MGTLRKADILILRAVFLMVINGAGLLSRSETISLGLCASGIRDYIVKYFL